MCRVWLVMVDVTGLVCNSRWSGFSLALLVSDDDVPGLVHDGRCAGFG